MSSSRRRSGLLRERGCLPQQVHGCVVEEPTRLRVRSHTMRRRVSQADCRDQTRSRRGILRNRITSFRSGRAGDCDVCREADGCRHDEAVVVVGVFADQIDAARRAEDSWLTSKSVLKVLGEIACLHPLGFPIHHDLPQASHTGTHSHRHVATQRLSLTPAIQELSCLLLKRLSLSYGGPESNQLLLAFCSRRLRRIGRRETPAGASTRSPDAPRNS